MSNYNQKLFSGGIRGYLHQMRFRWLKKHLIEPENGYSLFELGCFDCRSLHYLPKPRQYLGADAGWEAGLNDAQMTYATTPGMELVMAQSVQDLAAYQARQFDYSIALETLEHIPDSVLLGYVEFLAKVTKKRLLITVPVEIGPVFLIKYVFKRMLPHLHSGETDSYTLKEIIDATRGRMEHVQRFEHKGFDYRALIELIQQHFYITHIEGIPFTRYPKLSFQIGIIAQPKGTL